MKLKRVVMMECFFVDVLAGIFLVPNCILAVGLRARFFGGLLE